MRYREFPLEALAGLSAQETVTTLGRWVAQLHERAAGLRDSIDQLKAQVPLDEGRKVSLIRRRDKLRHLLAEAEELEGMLEVQVQHMPVETGGSVPQRFMEAAMELLPAAMLEEIERRAGIAGL